MIRRGFGLTGIALVLATSIWLLVDGAEIAFVVLTVALSSAPFLLYIAFMKTRFATIVTGAGLLVATAIVYVSVFTSDSSTASLGLAASPMINFAIVAVGGAIDSFVRGKDEDA